MKNYLNMQKKKNFIISTPFSLERKFLKNLIQNYIKFPPLKIMI